ncbi:MAG: DUF1573 domain-containing protein [Planctomycetota bacterium]|jgi:hypothetical protein|nr:DUF1573 domain-containing protein [Planctomycetota bacterium]
MNYSSRLMLSFLVCIAPPVLVAQNEEEIANDGSKKVVVPDSVDGDAFGDQAGMLEHDEHEGHQHASDIDWTKPEANSWFPRTMLDLGSFFQEEDASGVFKFKNPTKAICQLKDLAGSCTCTHAVIRIGGRKYVYDSEKNLSRVLSKDGNEVKERVSHINVGPGESGELEVHMNIGGFQGDKEANLTIQTSDPDMPLTTLHWKATGATYFIADPPDIALNEMDWADKREFQFEITSPLKKDFEITGHDPLPATMKISYRKEMRGDKAVWLVQGSYGPGVDPRDGGGQIVFKTNVEDKTVTVGVSAIVKGPLEMTPGGFLSFGAVRSSEGKTMTITLTPVGEFELNVNELEVTGLSLKAADKKFFGVSHRKDGKSVKVDLTIKPGIPRSIVRGTLKVHLNHPGAKMKEVMFNGFVR